MPLPADRIACGALALALALGWASAAQAQRTGADSGAASEPGAASDSDSDSGSGSESGSDSASGSTYDDEFVEDLDRSAPASAAPQVAASEPDGPARALSRPRAEPAGDIWVLDDGLGADVPWDDFDPAEHYLPHGQLNIGVQLRGGGLAGASDPVPAGPYFEAGFFLDIRYSQRSPWRLRIVAGMSLQPTGQRDFTSDGFFGGPCGGADSCTIRSSAFALRLRVLPISVDVDDILVLRAGGGLDLFWAELTTGGGAFQPLPAAQGEVAFKLLDGQLELGVFGGLTMTSLVSLDRFSFGGTGTGVRVTSQAQALLGLSVGYIIR